MRQKSVKILAQAQEANSAAIPPLDWARGSDLRQDLAGPTLLSCGACWGKPSPGVWLAPVGGGLPCA